MEFITQKNDLVIRIRLSFEFKKKIVVVNFFESGQYDKFNLLMVNNLKLSLKNITFFFMVQPLKTIFSFDLIIIYHGFIRRFFFTVWLAQS